MPVPCCDHVVTGGFGGLLGREILYHHLLEAISETATVLELRQQLLYTTPSGWWRCIRSLFRTIVIWSQVDLAVTEQTPGSYRGDRTQNRLKGHIYIYIYIYTHIYIYVYIYIYIYIYIYTYIYIYMHTPIYIERERYACVYMYTCICIYIYIYTHIYMHVCMYIY